MTGSYVSFDALTDVAKRTVRKSDVKMKIGVSAETRH